MTVGTVFQGIWSAIWMMPTDGVYVSWPISGELDIMEAVNLKTKGENNNRVFQTIHFGGSPPDNKLLSTFRDLNFDLTTNFHFYAIEWQLIILVLFVPICVNIFTFI